MPDGIKFLDEAPVAPQVDAETVPVSFVVIAAESDAHYVIDLLKTIPPKSEVIILWNKRGDDGSVVHRKDVTFANGTIIRYYATQWQELDFSQLRNTAIGLASREWIMWLDADDRLLIHQHGFFTGKLLEYPPGIGGLICGCVGIQPDPRPGRAQEGAARYHVPHIRLIRNGYGFRFTGRAHEQIGWAVQEQAFMMVECSLIVHHVGYETDADTMRGKLERNLAGVSAEYLNATDPERKKFWAEMMRREASNIHNYKGS
ncbi:MAG TPA: hypothetical protein DCZ59_08580 [Bacteroidetes bacterium]|nr:hypothetical protein [Bacteroidota bacterium]